MRADFPEFYRPTDDELRGIYRTGTIALDANILLSLYEVGPAQREEILDLFRRIGDRLLVPYQAGLEFHRRRLTVVQKQARVYADIRRILTKAESDVIDVIGSAKLDDEAAKTLRKGVRKSVRKAGQRIDAAEDRHGLRVEQAMATDPVLEALGPLLTGRVGDRPDPEVRQATIQEGVRRAKEQVPPGYLDADKQDDELVAGDYLLWSELLEHHRTAGRPTILVTNDTKEDWYAKVGNRTIGPRPELIVEMREASEHPYHQQTLAQFLRHAAASVGAAVTASTVDEVEAASTRRDAASQLERIRRLRRIIAQQRAARPDAYSVSAADLLGADGLSDSHRTRELNRWLDDYLSATDPDVDIARHLSQYDLIRRLVETERASDSRAESRAAAAARALMAQRRANERSIAELRAQAEVDAPTERDEGGSD